MASPRLGVMINLGGILGHRHIGASKRAIHIARGLGKLTGIQRSECVPNKYFSAMTMRNHNGATQVLFLGCVLEAI